MTPLDRLVVHKGAVSLAEAEPIMVARKVKKLPLVNADGTVLGLITAKDLIKHRRHPFATRDDQGRLRVAAAVGATGDYLERAVELHRISADVLVIDIAHGHSQVMERAIQQIRGRLGGVELVAGRGDGVEQGAVLGQKSVHRPLTVMSLPKVSRAFRSAPGSVRPQRRYLFRL